MPDNRPGPVFFRVVTMAILFVNGEVKATRIEGDSIIEFQGPCEARFRLQHTKDYNGEPDDLLWSDVSMMSDATLPLFESQDDLRRFNPFGVLVDTVPGYRRVVYRKARAEWLRVIPFDADDKANVEACAAFVVRCQKTRGMETYGNAR